MCRPSPHRDEDKSGQFAACQNQKRFSKTNIQQCWKFLRCLPAQGGRLQNIIIVLWFIFVLIITISDSRPVVRVIYSYTCDLSGRFSWTATWWPSGTTGRNQTFFDPEVALCTECPFGGSEDIPVDRSAWRKVEPCDSLWACDVREYGDGW